MKPEKRDMLIRAITAGQIEVIRDHVENPGNEIVHAETFLDLLKITSYNPSLEGITLKVSPKLMEWLNSLPGADPDGPEEV